MLTVLLVTTAVIVGTFIVGLASVWKRRNSNRSLPSQAPEPSEISTRFFERPNRWMAVRCSNILKVQAALGLHNPTPCPLHEGLAHVHEHKLFISPPVKGWIVVVGDSLPDAADDVDKLYHFLLRTARELGSVQYFNADRVLNHHTWVRIENAKIYRAYAWAGETLWNEGEQTAAERELELKAYDYCDAPLPFPFTARESYVANTDKVMQLAAKWSVDPMTITNQKATLGIAGDLSRRG